MTDIPKKKVINTTGVYCVQDLLKQSGGGLFSLVRICMLRAAEMAAGKPTLLDQPSSHKIITTVFEEIANGKITVKKVKKS